MAELVDPVHLHTVVQVVELLDQAVLVAMVVTQFLQLQVAKMVVEDQVQH
jgi:hypothetical protein